MKNLIKTGALAAAFSMGIMSAQADNVIRLATEGAYPPWNAVNSAGQLEGFEIELADELCARAKVECSLQQTAWDGIIPSLQQGKFDVIIAGMSITDKRKKKIAFSRAYASSPAFFVVSDDSPLKDFSTEVENLALGDMDDKEQAALMALKKALDGKTVGVQKGTIHLNFLKEYLKDEIDIRTYATQEQLDLDLQAGRVDIALAAMSYWHKLLSKEEGKNLLTVGPGVTEGPFGEGVGLGFRKKDQALADQFSVAIDSMVADGTLSAMAQKWFGFDAAAK
ncbi:transporter substrate-binding domain-containing protein [Endozoicomonas ascidiicola]|uniref:transporter substrate-binding domain-containing protein n=1 Tax=Endozoicomonas ascidiicola TaxID=1698521 RepID=UPI00082BCCF5|nr:transporter substrate-binding domain-containing protein [Endozoicomonas ascidiicola]